MTKLWFQLNPPPVAGLFAAIFWPVSAVLARGSFGLGGNCSGLDKSLSVSSFVSSVFLLVV